MKPRSHFCHSGFTLVEVLVATGLFALLGVGVAVATMAFLKNSQAIKLRATRDQVISQLRVTATDRKAIIKSLKKTENAAFYSCVCGIGTCTNLQQPLLDFTLYDTSDAVQSPAYYDISGSPCDPSMPQCVIRVTTSFFAQCAPNLAGGNQNPPPNCNGTPAEFVAIYYRVDENPNVSDLHSNHLKPISGPVYSPVADIYSKACP